MTARKPAAVVDWCDEAPGSALPVVGARAKPSLLGLPCSRCRAYYEAELDACPVCGCTERVSPTAASPTLRSRSVAQESPADSETITSTCGLRHRWEVSIGGNVHLSSDGQGGGKMQRQPSCCDFCGNAQTLREYPTQRGGVTWYACPDCDRIIKAEDWNRLIERSFAAYARIRPVPDSEEPILRRHVARLVEDFRSLQLVSVP